MTTPHGSPSTQPGTGFALPARVIVSLRAGVVLAIANVICVIIFACAWTKVKSEPKTIAVTGSAKKAITSDLVVWSAKVSTIDPDLPRAYSNLSDSVVKTRAFLIAQGVPESQIRVSSVGTWKRRARDEKGIETERISAYELWQSVEVQTSDVQRIGDVSRKITELIKDGVVVESNAPTYIYTKLADLKVQMLAEATRDATIRAQQIATNSNARLGAIVEARMGVMQINPLFSYEATGDGRNDTSSLDKEITAVVSARFGLE